MRSYDSRKEPPPEYDCTIWEAGRATCAIGAAFKPIKVGQSIFHDDGAGTFNPAPFALDEAVVNEWPGREIGVFISVGTGKRPSSSDSNQAQWYDGFLGEFAEARKRLIAKIEGCEKIHKQMMTEYLAARGVNPEHYYRFNVEIGVGEFGMNEWNRLAEISTGTRRYLGRRDESKMVHSTASKLAKIHRAVIRWERAMSMPGPARPNVGAKSGSGAGWTMLQPMPDIDMPFAVELPGDIPLHPIYRNMQQTTSNRTSFDSGPEALNVPNSPTSTHSSGEKLQPPAPLSPPRLSQQKRLKPRQEDPDRLVVLAPTPAQHRTTATSKSEIPPVKRINRIEPPPLPPKTPLPEQQAAIGGRRPFPSFIPPYPIDDETPPPVVDMTKKPEYRAR